MISANWTRENLAWLAGIVEGEGCISRDRARIDVSMCDKDVIDRLLAVSGCGCISGPYIPVQPHHKPQWRWQVSCEAHAYALLVAILPQLGKRRAKAARLAIDVFLAKPDRETKRIHGTRSRYRAGCRCDSCRAAVAAHQKAMLTNRQVRLARAL